MRISINELRRIIQEELSTEFKEEFDNRDYQVTIEHSKTFDLPNGEKFVVPGYGTSQIRGKIRDNTLELIYIRVDKDQQGKGLARALVEKALEFAKKHNLKVVSSGVYSADGSALMKSFEKRGLAKFKNNRHEFE